MARVLVIGGTRFIGMATVRRLLEVGNDVAVFNRGHSHADLPPEVKRFTGDRGRLHAHARAFESFAPNVVLHNIVSSEQHARECAEVFERMAPRIVLVSSQDVYRTYGRCTGLEPGPADPTPQDEDAPLRDVLYPYRAQATSARDPRHAYDKIPAERVLRAATQLRTTILRLPMVLGPADPQRRLLPLVKPICDGRPAIVMQKDYAHWRATYGYVDNVAEAISLACSLEEAAGRTYNVADGSLSMLELAGLVASALSWEGEVVLRPREALPKSLVAGCLRTDQPLVCTAERIRRELGFEERLPLEAGVARTATWERDHPPAEMPPGLLDYAAEDRVLEQVRAERGRVPRA